ncbi:MAG: hypothetical protein QF718_03430, partial [Phycisphaerales bacterium]|nr:hypothetical protein [Phycisphaerales bacterium]
EDVLEHYSTLENFVSSDHHRETILEPLNLTEQQKADLIAFLESLTAPLPDESLLSFPSSQPNITNNSLKVAPKK